MKCRHHMMRLAILRNYVRKVWNDAIRLLPENYRNVWNMN